MAGLLSIFSVLAYSVFVAVLSEVISWHFAYKRDDYVRVISQLDRLNKQIDSKTPAAGSEQKNKEKKVAKLQDQKKALTAQLMPFNTRMAMVNLVVMLCAYQLLNGLFGGAVIALLPFEPMGMFTAITHRGLEGENFREASAHFFFALGLMWARANVQKSLETYGVKPRQPAQMGLWEMAEQEAKKFE